MPRRNLVFGTDEAYHVFNRSVGNVNIFSSKIHLRKTIEIVNYYRYPQSLRLSKFKSLNDVMKQDYLLNMGSKKPLVELFAFSFMPNHFHFLLKQLQENGIIIFISALQNSFAKYFNIKYDRHGSLFQEQFKAKRVENDEQFLHVSRYIHLNHVTAYLITMDELFSYPWSSFVYYQRQNKLGLVNIEFIKQLSGSIEIYNLFVADQVDYQRSLAEIKDIILE